jgi:RNA polymerase sigma-70 factor (TIGR02943 family)
MNISEWVESFSGELYSWALYKVSDPETAKDLVQDTFLAAAEKFEGFEGNSSPKTWLFAILNNKIIDFYRKKANKPVNRDNQIFSEFFDEEERWKAGKNPRDWQEEEKHLLDNIDFRVVLKKCLDELPDKWNACVQLKFLEDKKGEAICQEIGITPSNFWQIIHRAKLQLRECIEVNWFE